MNPFERLISSEFHQPLWLLLMFFPVISFIYHYFFSKIFLPGEYFDPNMRYWYLNHSKSFMYSNKRHMLINFLFWFLFSVSLAGPEYAETLRNEINTDGDGILVLLDVSNSMNATDEIPSRLIRAKNKILLLVDKLKQGDKLGVMLFSASSHLLFPPTNDKRAMRFYISQIKQDLLPISGSVFQTALNHAQNILSDTKHINSPGNILLISDGDVGDESSTIDEINNLDLVSPVYILGVGKTDNSPIPSYNTTQQWLTSNDGNVITSNRNDNFLRNISAINSGKYHLLSDTESDLDQIYITGIKKDNNTDSRKGNTNWIQLYHPFLFLSLLLLFYQRILMPEY